MKKRRNNNQKKKQSQRRTEVVNDDNIPQVNRGTTLRHNSTQIVKTKSAGGQPGKYHDLKVGLIGLISGAILVFLGFMLPRWFSGPDIEVTLEGFQQHLYLRDGPVNTYIVIPATVYNNGDKPFFLHDVVCYVELEEKWVRLSNFYKDSLDDVENGTNSYLKFESRVNLDTVGHIEPQTEIKGRFLFATTNQSVTLDPAKPYKFKIDMIDPKRNKVEFGGMTTVAGSYYPTNSYDPNNGIRRIPKGN